MALTIQPVIRDGKVEELSLHFDRPLSLLDFTKFLDKLDVGLEFSQTEESHKHHFMQFPIYSNGEMIAVLEKCRCGATRRQYV